MYSLLVAMTLATTPTPLVHDVAIDRGAVPLTLRYEADVAVQHRQVGSVVPGGRPETLRCHWTAGAQVRRTLVRQGQAAEPRLALASAGRLEPLSGHRPGWCDANRAAIAEAVEAGLPALRTRLVAFAERDRATLASEIDDATALFRTGG